MSAALSLVTGVAGAQQPVPPDSFWRIPEGALASWAVDPGALAGAAPDHHRAIADAAACWAARASVGAADLGALDALLTHETIGPSPYRIVLTRLEASCDRPVRHEPGVARVGLAEAVLQVFALDDHAFIKKVEAAAGAPPTTPLQIEGLIDARSAPTPRGTVQWGRTEESVLVGFGPGSLERWQQSAARESRPARVHERALKRSERIAFQAWADLNALRTAAPELFAWGRLGALIEPWSLANSRSLYLCGRIIAPEGPWRPPLLSIDAAWSPRSEPPNSVHTRELTERAWPADLGGLVPPDVPYAAVLKANWQLLFDGPVATASALAPRRPEFDARLKRWTSTHASSIVEVMTGLRERAIVVGPSATPGAPALILQTNPVVKTLDRRIDALSASLGGPVRKAPGGGWRLQSDAAASPPPWNGLLWRLSEDRRWITLSWSPPTR